MNRIFLTLALLAASQLSLPAQNPPTAVFVELTEPAPTAVARYEAAQRGEPFDEALHRAAIRLAQDELLAELVAAGIAHTLTSTGLASGMEIPDRYSELINAVRLELDGWDVAAVRRMSGVKHISVDEGARLVLDRSVPYIRANGDDSARSRGVRGAGQVNPDGSSTGQVIAVLDTGIDHTNPMFDTTAVDGARDAFSSDARPVRLQGSPYVEGVNHPKVAYRFLFAQAPFEGDDTGHGTNVASTAAGLRATDSLGTGSEVEGVAPGAILMDYKVCPSLVCVIPQVMLALEDCALDTDLAGFPKPQCTVVNMSFGSDAGDPNSAHGTAAGNLQFLGVVPEASAGNAGPGENTIGSPSASRRVISSAATTDPGVSPNSIDVLEQNQSVRDNPGPAPDPGNLSATGSTFLAFFATESNGGLGFDAPVAQYYVDVGFGDTPEQVPVSVNGRICLSERGSTVDADATGSGLFANKANQCAAKGGIGLVVFNNASGQIGAVLAPSSIPVFSTSGEAGQFLRGLGFDAEGISNFPIRLNPEDPTLFVADTAGFSSRGPNNDFRVIKPDITAPGVSILMGASKIGALGSPTGFTSASGTSFSGPHISGVAALVRDAAARFDFTPSQVRAAMMNSSTNLRQADGTPIPDDDDNNFIHETGAGLTDVVRALDVKTLMGANQLNGPGGPDASTHPDFLPSHSFGELGLIGTGLPAGDSRQQQTITVTMTDVSGGSLSYDLSIVDAGALRGDVTRPLDEPGFSVSLDSSSVSVPAGGSATFDVTIAVDGTESGLQIAGADVTGFQATEFLWYVTASPAQGGDSLRMPFYARIVEGDGVPPGVGDKVTGGGYIPDGVGGKANFGFNAKGKNSGVSGNIDYISKAHGISLKGEVTSLTVNEFDATFSGTCTLRDVGADCEYTVNVEDNAEPGSGADRFAIQVFTPEGVLLHQADDLLAGGNIQIHKSQ